MIFMRPQLEFRTPISTASPTKTMKNSSLLNLKGKHDLLNYLCIYYLMLEEVQPLPAPTALLNDLNHLIIN